MNRGTSQTVPTAVFSTAFRESMENEHSNNQSTNQADELNDQSINQHGRISESINQSFGQSIDDHSLRSLHIADDPDQSINQTHSADSTINIKQPMFHEDIESITQPNHLTNNQSNNQTLSPYPDLAPKPPATQADQTINQTIKQSIKTTPSKADKQDRDLRSSTLPASINQSTSSQSSHQSITASPYKQSRVQKRSMFDASCASDSALQPPDDHSIHQSTNHTTNHTTHPSDNLSLECRRAWSEARTVVFKDLPRLVKRMNVVDDKARAVVWGRIANNQTPEQSNINQAIDPSIPSSSVSRPTSPPNNQASVVIESELADISTFEALQNVVLAVASRLETTEDVEKISRAFHTVGLSLTASSDLESLLSDLFLTVIGEDSLTFAVFRGCHQSILFPAVFALKTSVYSTVGDLKDVRRHDGWTIEIFIGRGRVQICHTRVEQSLHPLDSAEHFEVTWNLSLNFDRQMRNLTAAFLRIQDLKCHDNMTKQRKSFIEDNLKGCGYIV